MKAVIAARALAPYARRKQNLLETLGSLERTGKSVGRGVQDTNSELLRIKKSLRKNFFREPRVHSWEDFAQLLDSRGSFRIIPGSGSLHINIFHTNKDLLLSLSAFIQELKGSGTYFPRVHRKRFFREDYHLYAWDLKGKTLPVLVIEKVIEYGIVLQRERAEKTLQIIEVKAWYESLPVRNNQNRLKVLSTMQLQITELIASLKRSKVNRDARTDGDSQQVLRELLKERVSNKIRTEMYRLKEEIKSLTRV